MNNFPFYQHFVAKIFLHPKTDLNEQLVDNIADLFINSFGLKVVSRGKYEYTNNGLTKFYVLSQSHLVIHTWPENRAIHIDLMTCNTKIIEPKLLEKVLKELPIEKIKITKLKY